MSGTLKEYDPRQVIITWDGVNLNEGIADGTFLTLARVKRMFSLNVGGDGGGTRVRSNDRSGVAEVTIRMGSKTNGLLSDRVKDEETGVSHVSALMVKDFSGNTVHTIPQAFLDGPPDEAFATEEGDHVWRLLCLDLNMDSRENKDA